MNPPCDWLEGGACATCALDQLKDATIVATSHSPQLSLAKDKIRVLLLEGVNDIDAARRSGTSYSRRATS
ncbi:hypothetical protein UP09_15410 [Bradyrhizobium sp. LTSP885]|nr:hypothetical protein UP09_15410 [Bradyrhizobium sp. LTSP885]